MEITKLKITKNTKKYQNYQKYQKYQKYVPKLKITKNIRWKIIKWQNDKIENYQKYPKIEKHKIIGFGAKIETT